MHWLHISLARLYRLILSKPKDVAMRFYLKIENTTNLLMMEWVLSEYVKSYVREQRQLNQAVIISPDSANPFDWADLNFDGFKWTAIAKQYNMGFHLRTTSDELMRMCMGYQLANFFIRPLELPDCIKHNSILYLRHLM
jgi:hypothetical protein